MFLKLHIQKLGSSEILSYLCNIKKNDGWYHQWIKRHTLYRIQLDFTKRKTAPVCPSAFLMLLKKWSQWHHSDVVPHLHSAPYPLFVIMFFCLCMSFRSLYVVMSFCLRILKSLFLLCPLSLYVIMSICLRTLKSPIVQSFQSLPVIMSFCLRTFKVLFIQSPLSSCTS